MIIKLHQNLINKIAAGEVVERPASILKELLENAIDANATKIDITIKDHGIGMIQVQDNGIGMTEDDLDIACDSHTTSKLTTIDDLSSIGSMGFRGEALASISAVSQVEITSKTKEGTIGHKLEVTNGKKQDVEEVPANRGTTITVSQIFQKIPARKKFLKSPQTEYKHILETFQNYALAFPNIHFTLTHNGKEIYNLPDTAKESFNDELLVRIQDLFGKEIATNLVATNYKSPYVHIQGFIGHPRIARSGRNHQLIFLNKRPIRDKIIARAVLDAYRGLIPKGKYPTFFLFLSIDPTNVDVNVHPRKSEVRFENGQHMFASIKQAAKQTILQFLQQDSKKALNQYRSKTSKNKSFSFNTKTHRQPSADNVKIPSQLQKTNVKKAITFSKELLQGDDEVTQRDTLKEDVAPASFQLFNAVIVIEKDNEAIFIDQHAAAERVTFEQLKEQYKKESVQTQKLLLPETIELSKTDFELIKIFRKKIAKLGIDMSIFGKSTVKVEEIPALLAHAQIKDMVMDIISSLHDQEEIDPEKPDSFEDAVDHIIATMACHSSIRANMKLERSERDEIAKKLLTCENPYSCPHGRPIMWKLSRHDLEKKFDRP